MTRYVFSGNMLENCTDADLDPLYVSHISVGAGSVPVLIDWAAAAGGVNPYVTVTAWAGHVEIYRTGVRIYDDHGTPTLNPSGGHIAAGLKLQFRASDTRGGVSSEIAQDILYLQGVAPGSDPVAPAPVDMVPAVGAVGQPVDGLIAITWSKTVLPGAGSLEIRNVGTNALIETLTLPGAISATYPPAAGKVYLSDDQTVIKPTADLPVGINVSFRPGFDFVRNLSGTSNAAITDNALAFATVPGASASPWGYQTGVDYGTAGNMFVDAVNGNDANNGLTIGAAKRTISAALAAWTAGTGGKIKVANGSYKETPSLKSGASNASRLIIEPYGAAAPVIDCSEPMTTGWTLCTIADQPVIGANYASIYKKTGIPINSFPQSDPMNANLFAGSMRLNIARKYRYGQNVSCWCRSFDLLTADSVTLSGTNITAYQHAGLLAAFTPAQIAKAIIIAQAAPNVTVDRKCTVSGGSIIPNSPIPQDSNASIGWNKNFGLFNLLPAMEQGGWGYDWDGVSATCDLYVWLPAGKTTADIRYTSRTNGFLFGAVNHIIIQGLTVQNTAGSSNNMEGTGPTISNNFGNAFAGGQTGLNRANITIENNIIKDGWWIGSHGGGVYFQNGNNILVRKNSFLDLQASEGITINNSNTVLAEWNKFDKVFREDFWPRATSKVVYAHNLHTGAMSGHSHNNGVAFYVTNEGLEWGNIWKNATFFATWQDANNIQICFNFFEWTGAYNAIKDQSSSVNGFAATIGGMVLNNTIALAVTRTHTVSHGIFVAEGANHTFSVKNNISHGASLGSTTVTAKGGNVNTRNTAGDFGGGTGDVYEAPDTTFRDRANGDYSIGSGSIVRSSPGQSITAEVAALAATYPFFTDFTDPFGQAINFNSPPRGAMTNFDINPMMAA